MQNTKPIGETTHACCAEKGPALEVWGCPACGFKGPVVPSITLQSLLKESVLGDMIEGPYRFCANPGCEVAYFTQEGGRSFLKQDLTVRVGLKERESPRPLCYCFGHSVESLVAEWHSTGRMTALESIRAEVKAGSCRCESLNPSGRCCLGDVIKVTKEIQSGEPSTTCAPDEPDGIPGSSCCK